MTTSSSVDPRSAATRPLLDEPRRLPSGPHPRRPKQVPPPKHQQQPIPLYRSGEPNSIVSPRLPPQNYSLPARPGFVRRMSSVPELRDQRLPASPAEPRHRRQVSAGKSHARGRQDGVSRDRDAGHGEATAPQRQAYGTAGGNRLARQKSMERGIVGLPPRPSPQGKRSASGGNEGRGSSRPGSRNDSHHHPATGIPPGARGAPSPGLKMPLAFNNIARERGFTTGSQPRGLPFLPHPSQRKSPTSGAAPNPSSSAPDLSNAQESGYVSPRYHPRDAPRSHPLPPQPPYSSSGSASSSPHNSIAPLYSGEDVRTSFRSAISASGVSRSSTFTASSETEGSMTVDEAIGMYGSDSEGGGETTDAEESNRRSKGDSVLGGKTSRQGSFAEDPGPGVYSMNSYMSGDLSPGMGSRRSEQDAALEEEAARLQGIPRDNTVDMSNELSEDAPVIPLQNPSDRNSQTIEKENILEVQRTTSAEMKDSGISESDVPNNPPSPVEKPQPIPQPRQPAGADRAKEARDRYGFRKQTQHITLAEYEEWEARYDETLDRRRKKWEQLLRESGLTPGEGGPVRFPPKSAKIKRYVRKGIPPEWRGAAWFWYAGGQKYLNKYPGLYDQLVQRGLNSPDSELIERDLHRTFPDNIKFKPDQGRVSRADKLLETPIVQQLRRVLVAFSLHVPKIGYCQSLNFLAGLLLLFMPEEKAFWMLYIMTQQYLPGTHELNLEGSSVDQWVLMLSVRESLPTVWSKIGGGLDGSEVEADSTKLPPVTLCTSAWFMSGFIGSLPIETVLRVWDCLFYEGSKTLFRIAMTIFKVGEVQIKAVNDPMEIFQVVQTIPRKLIDAGQLIETCYRRRNGFGHLSQETIDQRRKERREKIAEERRSTMGVRVSKDDGALRNHILAGQNSHHHDLQLGRRFRKIIKA